MKDLRVHAVTFNVADSGPPKDDFSDLLGLNDKNHPDVIFIGLQEAAGDNWMDKFKDTLRPADYVLIKNRECWEIHIYAFVKRNLLVALTNIESEVTALGALGIMGNKGGVSIRFELCGVNIIGVCAHLSAHQNKVNERIRDYTEIISDQTFRDTDVNKILDHDYVIWMGDLNFRIDMEKEQAEALIKKKDYTALLLKDQLTIAKRENFIFENFQEGEIKFDPTYKFNNFTDIYDTSEKKRVPSWTDRILYMAHDSFIYNDQSLADGSGHRVAHQQSNKSTRGPPKNVKSNDSSLDKPSVTLLKYDSMTKYKHSDHRPVYAQLLLKIPDLWYSLPIKFLQPTNKTHKADQDLVFQYTLMKRPALVSALSAGTILKPAIKADVFALDQLDLDLSNKKDDNFEIIDIKDNFIGSSSSAGKKKENESDPLPPPSMKAANLDWIGIYPVDFDDLRNGYLAYVYAPSGQADSTLDASMKRMKITNETDHVVLDHGKTNGIIYKGHIDEKFLDEHIGRTVQLVYFSKRKNCPQGYSQPFTITSSEW